MSFELVIGGAASGKSEYAEQTAVEVAAQLKTVDLVYIATMAARDSESLRRIEDHRRRRSGRGFRTIEKPTDLSAIDDIDGAVVVLEDLSNLTANELFVYEDGAFFERTPELALEKVLDGIDHLIMKSACLIAVTNDIFEDGGMLEGSMLSYTKLLGEINSAAALRADRVTELVCGTPVSCKYGYKTEEARAAREKAACVRDEEEPHPPRIIFITGGFCQGKTAFARSIVSSLKMAGAGHVMLVDDFHHSIRQAMTQMMSRGPVTGSDFSCSDTITEYKCCGRECAHRLIKGLCGQDYSAVVVISALPCSGPVPIDQFERSWRDEVGKACQVIAMYSSEVYRMLCGIPQRLK